MRTKETPFHFDQAFDPASSQEEVFQTCCGPIIKDVLNGFSGTVMAYGQTSSGKTYTIQGDETGTEQGFIPRMANMIFDEITAMIGPCKTVNGMTVADKVISLSFSVHR